MSTSITDPIEVTLQDGRRATIRPIRRDDVERTAAFIEALSAKSKHGLFLAGITRLSDAAMQRLCDSRSPRDMAYVATVQGADGERQIGVCRYAGAEEAVAEIAHPWPGPASSDLQSDGAPVAVECCDQAIAGSDARLPEKAAVAPAHATLVDPHGSDR